MAEDKPEIAKLSDEQIAQMLNGEKRKAKPDPDAPGKRLPEALYYYILTLLEAAILVGIWGYMLRGTKGLMKAPPETAPALDQFWWHVKFGITSTLEGLGDQAIDRPWLLAGVALGALAIFVPKTPRMRKRVVYLVSGVIVTSLAVLLVVQFTAEFGMATNRSIY